MKKIIFILSFFLLIYTPYIVSAETPYNIIENMEETPVIDIRQYAKNVLTGNIPLSFSEVIEEILALLVGGIKENFPNIIKIMSVAILSGLVLNLGADNSIGTFTSVAIVSVLALKTFSYCLSTITETVDSLFLFIQSMMTPVAAAVTVSGAASGGAAATIFVAMQVFIHICKSVLLPLICVITAFSICDKLGETPYLQGINNLLKQSLKWGTGLMLTIYTVIIALQTQTAAGFDTLAGKSLKYAVGSFVPVVGSTLADSLETVVASARTVAGALGIAGIIGVGYISIIPLVNICCISLSYKLASAIATVTAEKKVSSAINEIGDSIARISVMLLCVTVMFVISLAMLVTLGGGK